jgi:hypothetical protein
MKRLTLECTGWATVKAIPFALILTLGLVATADAQSKTKGQTTGSTTTYAQREKCIAKAQAQYPDQGLGQQSMMTQRTMVYSDCMRSAGMRP